MGNQDGRPAQQLDARDLSPAELHHIVDVVYMVVFDGGKGAAHPPDDPALLTVMDLVAADDVASHFFFDPSVVLSAAYGIPLHLGRALDMLAGKVVVVVRVQVLPEADAGALAVGDVAVFDDPALRPVRPYHAALIRRGGRPLRRGLRDGKAAHRDVSDPRLFRDEALFPDIDLHLFPVRVCPHEVGIKDRPAVFLLREPFEPGRLRIPGILIDLRLYDFFHRRRLIQHLIIQINS